MTDVSQTEQIPLPRRRKRFDLFPYLLIMPVCLLLAVVTIYPTFQAFYLAMTDASLLRMQKATFIGLQNVRRMMTDQVFLDGLWRTLRWDVAVVSIELAIALPLALFLNLEFRGRGFVRAAMMVPYITPPAVVGLLFLYMFDGNFGVVNDLLVRAGVTDQYITWMGGATSSFWVVVTAMVWYGTPLMALILLAALQTIPADLYEAADVDGAGWWSSFISITLPHIMPTIFFIVLLRMIWMSNHIDLIFVMTGGGPGFSNHTEAVYSFMLTNQFQIGYASAIAVVLALLLMILSVFYVRHLARNVLVNAP